MARNKLTKKQLTHFKEKLLQEKQRVLEEMGEISQSNTDSIRDHSGEVSSYTHHLGDAASTSYEREFSLGLYERQQKYLQQIDEALDRIEDGSYGICKVTNEPISVERLEEVPVAKYSVKGKELLERQKNE
jgi:RNA polymerase-binding protein DksA